MNAARPLDARPMLGCVAVLVVLGLSSAGAQEFPDIAALAEDIGLEPVAGKFHTAASNVSGITVGSLEDAVEAILRGHDEVETVETGDFPFEGGECTVIGRHNNGANRASYVGVVDDYWADPDANPGGFTEGTAPYAHWQNTGDGYNFNGIPYLRTPDDTGSDDRAVLGFRGEIFLTEGNTPSAALVTTITRSRSWAPPGCGITAAAVATSSTTAWTAVSLCLAAVALSALP